MRPHRKIHHLVLGAIAVAVFATIGTSAAWAKPKPGGGSSAGCPSSIEGYLEAHNVGARFEASGETATYWFESFEAEEETSPGVPGLVSYCVYPPTAPTSGEAVAQGANGEVWNYVHKGKSPNFSFDRPNGNKSNVPLDGEETEIGTATWEEGAPEEQTILLHINDPGECGALYPTEAETCFVLPGEPPVCKGDTGSEDFAYNAIPFHLCPPPPAIGFQAQRTSEFGDEVELEGGGGELESLTVDFQSYACEEGFWNQGETDPCKSSPGGEFEHPITAHLYNVGAGETVGAQIAELTETFKIPYRPSADPTQCPDLETPGEIEANSKWKDPVSGLCVNSKSALLTWDFPSGINLPSQVIWTVSFSTSNAGYPPLGNSNPCNSGPGGCPYDSLNVGDYSYENAPYAGEDVNEDVVFQAKSEPFSPLSRKEGWSGYRPLGQITTK
jgi:hypothetical protein